MNPFIYLRGLRYVEHTVFAVNDGQKYFVDPQFGKRIAYSSGQQVKRSILESLDLPIAAITFNWEIDKKDQKASQKEPHSPCDPSYPDQLLGGYMKAESGALTVKRRSPLSISAMTPLHPLLGGIEYPTENLSFDRTSHPEVHKVNVYWKDGSKRTKLTDDELEKWLTDNKRSLPNRAFIQDETRVSGLYTYDVAIDLRRLFCVSTNKLEPELFPNSENELKEKGWIETKNIFGKCLLCPEDKRNEIIDRLCKSLIDWRITSNQARAFSLMETRAIAIGKDANQIAYSIRGELSEDTERPTAVPRIDHNAAVDLFLTPTISASIAGESGDAKALENAKAKLKEMILDFPFEKQLDDSK
jgi:hypothetical protein